MNLAFIWHMHQPDYRNSSGVMQMPWVFLHSIKDYYDMPWMMSRHKGMKATFNITPPLIEQIKLYYDEPQNRDYFLNLWYKKTEYLDQSQRNWMIKICKSAQFDTMVTPLPHFKTLFQKEYLSDSELFDLQVLFILSWCGVYLRENSQVISKLIKKELNYTFDDKTELLGELTHFIKGIFDYYKSLHVEGRISLSTTPLNHPILPLLLDMENAKTANPNTDIPNNHKPMLDDANLQIQRATTLFEDTFGFTPKGFWPAEGAVDKKSVKILKDFGIEWIATDEAILFKSLQNNDRNNLYHPYRYKDMCIGFRDHGLSDLIGFTYRFQESNQASENFINALKSIENQNQNSTVFVILDGENAWEFYKNNAFDFFDSLYSKLGNLSWCKTITMDDVCKLEQKVLENLQPGSWIHGEFNTWVGHREKTQAWNLIYLTKSDFEKNKDSLDEQTKEKITEHFLAAECSDWFWWYGDDHHTDFGAEFDTLFRNHLIDIYNLMKIAPPDELFKPICKIDTDIEFHLAPKTYISPVINGKQNSFFEWIGCGIIDETKLFSTMDKTRGPIKKIYYGQDEKYIYFAFVSDMSDLLSCETLNIKIDILSDYIIIPIKKGSSTIRGKHEISFACDDWLEFKIEKENFGKTEVKFRFEVIKNNMIVQTAPSFGELELNTSADYSQNWFI